MSTSSAPVVKMNYFCVNCQAESVRHLLCSGCKNAHYCNPVCQKADWKRHKDDCKKKAELISAIGSDVDDNYRKWREHSGAALTMLAIYLGDPGINSVIFLSLDYKQENHISTKFQIKSYLKASVDNIQTALSEDIYNVFNSYREDSIAKKRDFISAFFIVKCDEAFGKDAIRVSAALNEDANVNTKVADSNACSELVKLLNEGKLAFTKSDRRTNYSNMTPDFFPNKSDQSIRCGDPSCTKTQSEQLNLQKCSRCKKISYCCKECQTKHWVTHKSECDKAKNTSAQRAEGQFPVDISVFANDMKEVTVKGDEIAKKYGLKGLHEFHMLNADGLKNNNYKPLLALLQKKCGSKMVEFIFELFKLYDIDPSTIGDDTKLYNLRVWGNRHYNNIAIFSKESFTSTQQTQLQVGR